MRQHKILTRTLLTLSIINLAFAAPVAVRERHEVRLGANVTRNVTAASQKRWDPLVENVPGSDHAPPPSPDLTDLPQLAEQHRYTDSSRVPLDGLGSLTGSRLPVGSMPAAGSLLPPPEPESWSLNVPGSDHAPPPNLDPADVLLQLKEQLAAQQRYIDSLRFPLDSPGSLTGSRLPVGSMPVANPLSLPPPPSESSNPGLSKDRFPSPSGSSTLFPHPSQPGPSEGRFAGPSGFSVNPDTLSATGSTGNQPTPPKSPGADPEIHSSMNPEPFPTEFWDKFLKGKIKRQISGSNAGNLVQKDPRSQIFYP